MVVGRKNNMETKTDIIRIPIESHWGGEYSIEYEWKYIRLMGIDKTQPLNQIINAKPYDVFEPVTLIPVVYEVKNASPKIICITEKEILIDLNLK